MHLYDAFLLFLPLPHYPLISFSLPMKLFSASPKTIFIRHIAATEAPTAEIAWMGQAPIIVSDVWNEKILIVGS